MIAMVIICHMAVGAVRLSRLLSDARRIVYSMTESFQELHRMLRRCVQTVMVFISLVRAVATVVIAKICYLISMTCLPMLTLSKKQSAQLSKVSVSRLMAEQLQ